MRSIFICLFSIMVFLPFFQGCCHDLDGNIVWEDNDYGCEKNRKNLASLKMGMTIERAMQAMESRFYYCIPGPICHPSRMEYFNINVANHLVYYFHAYSKSDQDPMDCPPEKVNLPEGQLTTVFGPWHNVPLVFRDGKLLGWGRCFLRELSPRYDRSFYERGEEGMEELRRYSSNYKVLGPEDFPITGDE